MTARARRAPREYFSPRNLSSSRRAHVYKLSAYCTPACARRINLNLAAGHSRGPDLNDDRPTTTKMKWHRGIERATSAGPASSDVPHKSYYISTENGRRRRRRRGCVRHDTASAVAPSTNTDAIRTGRVISHTSQSRALSDVLEN